MATRTQRFESRQTMKRKKFEVFHYRDPIPEYVGVHHHDFYEIYFFLSGQVDFRVEGKTYHMQPGDILLISPQELHQPEFGPDDVYERIVLWIDRSYMSTLRDWDTGLTACFDGTSDEYVNLLRPSRIRQAELGRLLEKLVEEFYSSAVCSTAYAQGLLLQFLVELNRLMKASSRQEKKQEDSDLIPRVLGYIGSHFQENITLESLAREFYVSKYYLSHEFSSRVGTSIYRYVIFRRLMLARELITAGHAPGEVYQQCGFGDYANFYRAFKAEYGVSPRAFAAEKTE